MLEIFEVFSFDVVKRHLPYTKSKVISSILASKHYGAIWRSLSVFNILIELWLKKSTAALFYVNIFLCDISTPLGVPVVPDV